jgi:uncharacterized protein
MRLALVPKPSEFFTLFTQAGANALETARKAEALFREFPGSTVTWGDVKALETEGDRLTHALIQLLNTQYVTPFDREDIYALAGAIDDVVDHIEHACDLLGLYKVGVVVPAAIEQCRVLVGTADRLSSSLGKLRQLRGMEDDLVAIRRLEDEGDRIVRDAIAALFEGAPDPLGVIRWKDIFEALEDAIDACSHAAHVLGNILVKNG